LEKESTDSQREIEKLEKNTEQEKNQFEAEIRRIGENRVKNQASLERQKSALQELYQEKRLHLIGKKGKLIRERQKAEEKLKQTKAKSEEELQKIISEKKKAIAYQKNQMQAKQDGWELALKTINKQLESIREEKDTLQKKLKTVRDENDKELETVRSSMMIAKEQLEVDKATLIEKAQEDQKQCEKEIQELQKNVEDIEKEFQTFTLDKDKRIKNEEEGFDQEEKGLKEALRVESEKRDYEQKLHEQEKTQKQKELNTLREDYEKKKWYWDNQMRNLMMQKSVLEAEYNAEKMRVDREARVALKSLEAKRDELKQTFSGIKSRYAALKNQDVKETELRNQRWRWRKDRLWSMWQNRLTVIKKERTSIQSQLAAFESTFFSDRSQLRDDQHHEQRKIDNLQQFIIQVGDRNKGDRKQKEVQIELEKTRILAQIKECETLITEWKDRLKTVQEDVNKQNIASTEQMRFLERFFKEEEQETTLFLRDLKNIISLIEVRLNTLSASEDAA